MSAPKKNLRFSGYCPTCGALLPHGCNTCPICTATVSSAQLAGTFPPPDSESSKDRVQTTSVGTLRTLPQIWIKYILTLASVIFLTFTAVLGTTIYWRFFDTSRLRAAESILFEDADGRLMLSYPGINSPREVSGISAVGSSGYSGHYSGAENGRYLAFTDTLGRLYMLDFARASDGKNDFAALQIAEDVTLPIVFVGNDEQVVYKNKKNDLYVADKNNVRRMDTNVSEIIAVSRNQVLYTRRTLPENQLNLCLSSLKDGGALYILDRNISEVLDSTADLSKILYTRLDQMPGKRDTLSIRQFSSSGSSSTTLAGGVERVWDASASSGVCVYLTRSEDFADISDVIIDDLADEDSLVQPPEIETYPFVTALFAKYGTETDLALHLTEFEAQTEEYLKYAEELEIWQVAQQRDLWRDDLFEQLNSQNAPAVAYDLYVYRSGKSYLIDYNILENFAPDTLYSDIDKNYIIYEAIGSDPKNRPLFSQIWQNESFRSASLNEIFRSGVEREMFYCTLSGNRTSLYSLNPKSSVVQCVFTQGTDDIYFTVNNSVRSSLYFSHIKSGIAQKPTSVIRSAEKIIRTYDGGIVFLSSSILGDAYYIAFTGAAEPISDFNIQLDYSITDQDALLFFETAQGRPSRNLQIFTPQAHLSVSNVSAFSYRNKNLLYILSPTEKFGKYDIYQLYSGQKALLASDAFFPPVFLPKTTP